MAEYQKDIADVTVAFTNGEVKTYRISSGPSIHAELVREAAANEALTLRNNDETVTIPIEEIRDWAVNPVPVEGDA